MNLRTVTPDRSTPPDAPVATPTNPSSTGSTSSGPAQLVTTLPTPRTVRVLRVAVPVLFAVVVIGGLFGLIVGGRADTGELTQSQSPSTTTGDAVTGGTQPRSEPPQAVVGDVEPEQPPAPSEQPQVDPESPIAPQDPDAGVAPLPAGTTRFARVPDGRVLDTRADKPVTPGETITVDVGSTIAADASAVALSVNVMGAERSGLVYASFDAGSIPVADLNGPMTSNLVIVPRGDDTLLTLTNAPGGHLVVDVVGQFIPSGPTAAGRFVAVEPITIGTLVTEIQGREATFDPGDQVLPASGVGYVVVRIRADVGTDGGVVHLGAGPDDLTQTMMWGPSSGDDRIRHGVAIVPLNDLGQWSLVYNGGSELEADLLGYFTDDAAAVSTSGLFVPLPTTRLSSGGLKAGQPATLDVGALVPDQVKVGAVAVSVSATASESGQVFLYNPDGPTPSASILDVGGGVTRNVVTITSTDLEGKVAVLSDIDADLVVETTGYFVAEG